MWIKAYRSLFLIIRIRKGMFRIAVPVPLFLFTQLFEALADLAALVELIAPVRIRVLPERFQSGSPFLKQASPYDLLEMLRVLFDEIRSVGRLRMVEIESIQPEKREKVSIYVDFV